MIDRLRVKVAGRKLDDFSRQAMTKRRPVFPPATAGLDR
jgi:hypothetical protein